ncbi:winged helix-turn-helix domain-containing protein [Desertihabitans brevis]|nr:crosslink repair DNA glycosylase YcaQ family protein [Desertihabitans brevis]
MPRETLTLAQARRVAVAAQGLTGRPDRDATMRDVQRLVDRLALLQIDSVNVAVRAHLMPLFSRHGPYDPGLLARASGRRPRRLFEYWAHEASLVDVVLQPALRPRMQVAAEEAWGRIRRVQAEQPHLLARVREEVAARGPISARDIQHEEERSREHWGWNWSSVKVCLEWLFWAGEITAARRNDQFERLYDLPERVLPPEVAAAPTPEPEEAVRTLVRRSARALGVADLRALADYFRLKTAQVRPAVDELVAAGELLPVTVRGLDRPHWLWHEARLPRRVAGRALLSPFDSMVFERQRLQELFDFRYRIEIYVPAPKRRYGYYVYPFLLGERLVARVDLKADRAAGVLVVKAAWAEPDAPAETAPELAAELALMASWLGLDDVVVHERGDLAALLQRAVALSR